MNDPIMEIYNEPVQHFHNDFSLKKKTNKTEKVYIRRNVFCRKTRFFDDETLPGMSIWHAWNAST